MLLGANTVEHKRTSIEFFALLVNVMDVEQIVEHDAIVVGGHGRAGARKNWAAYVRQILFVLNMLNFGGTGLLSLSLFSRSSAAQTKRFVGTVFGPTSSAPREVPTPLVLLTVPEWNSGSFERFVLLPSLLIIPPSLRISQDGAVSGPSPSKRLHCHLD